MYFLASMCKNKERMHIYSEPQAEQFKYLSVLLKSDSRNVWHMDREIWGIMCHNMSIAVFWCDEERADIKK